MLIRVLLALAYRPSRDRGRTESLTSMPVYAAGLIVREFERRRSFPVAMRGVRPRR
jgi:hypothetical protein